MRQRHDSHPLGLELSRALTRRGAPADLTDRVMARVRNEPVASGAAPRPSRAFNRLPFRWSWALTTSCGVAGVVLTLSAWFWHENREAERLAFRSAERELAEVLQLTGSKWNRAQAAAFAPQQGSNDD